MGNKKSKKSKNNLNSIFKLKRENIVDVDEIILNFTIN